MSMLSSFPELDGILFPSVTARELAEKRVLDQRAEQKAKEDELRRQQEEEERQRQEKMARIEKKRQEAEKRLQDLAKQRAAEDEAEAERLHKLAEEKKRQAEEQASRLREEQRKADMERQRREKDAADRKRQEEMDRQRQMEEERERKRRELAKKRQEEEKHAEKRWLKQQVAAGNIKLTKKKSGLVVSAAGANAGAPKVDDSLSWIKSAEELGDDIEIQEDPEEKRREEEEKKRREEELRKARRLQVAKKREEAPPPDPLDMDLQETDPSTKWVVKEKNLIMKAIQQHNGAAPPDASVMATLPDRLESRDEKFSAMLQLHSYLTSVVTQGGFAALRDEYKGGTYAQTLENCLDPLARIMKESPGNIVAMLCLGYLSFCGDKKLHGEVVKLKAIPNSVEGWIGWIVGSRLFFEYAAWWQTGVNGQSPETEWTLSCENSGFGSFGTATKTDRRIQRDAARNKIEQLVDCMVIKGINSKSVRSIMYKFDVLMDQFESKRSQLSDLTAGAEEDLQEKLRTAQVSQVETLKYSVERMEQSLNDARKEEERAKHSLRNIRAEMQRAEEKASHARARLSELADQQRQLEKERDSLEKSGEAGLTAWEDKEQETTDGYINVAEED